MVEFVEDLLGGIVGQEFTLRSSARVDDCNESGKNILQTLMADNTAQTLT